MKLEPFASIVIMMRLVMLAAAFTGFSFLLTGFTGCCSGRQCCGDLVGSGGTC